MFRQGFLCIQVGLSRNLFLDISSHSTLPAGSSESFQAILCALEGCSPSFLRLLATSQSPSLPRTDRYIMSVIHHQVVVPVASQQPEKKDFISSSDDDDEGLALPSYVKYLIGRARGTKFANTVARSWGISNVPITCSLHLCIAPGLAMMNRKECTSQLLFAIYIHSTIYMA